MDNTPQYTLSECKLWCFQMASVFCSKCSIFWVLDRSCWIWPHFYSLSELPLQKSICFSQENPHHSTDKCPVNRWSSTDILNKESGYALGCSWTVRQYYSAPVQLVQQLDCLLSPDKESYKLSLRLWLCLENSCSCNCWERRIGCDSGFFCWCSKQGYTEDCCFNLQLFPQLLCRTCKKYESNYLEAQ